MSERVHIFIDEKPIEVAAGDSVRSAVAAYDAEAAAALDTGTAYVTDGVGRMIAADRAVSVGDILRIIRSAPRSPDDDET